MVRLVRTSSPSPIPVRTPSPSPIPPYATPISLRYHSDAHLYGLRVPVILATGLSSDQRLIASESVATKRPAFHMFIFSSVSIGLMFFYCSLMPAGNYVVVCLFGLSVLPGFHK